MPKVRSETSWEKGLKRKRYPKLAKSIEADVIIIGGGITGIVSAYLLAKEGRRVVVLEKDTLGSKATGSTTAFLTDSLDTDFTDLLKALGEKDAREVVTAHGDAIRFIGEVAKREGIECEYKKMTSSTYAKDKDEFESLKEECRAANTLGASAKMVEKGHLGFPNAGYMELHNEAMFHPLKFLYGLARAATEYGALIYEHTEAKLIHIEDGVAVVKAGRFEVRAPWAISATYEPFNEPLRLYFKKGMYICYMFELFIKGITLREGCYEDMNNPYHFFRIEKEKEGYRVILGGEDHRKDFPVSSVKSFNALKEYADTLFPAGDYSIRRKWRGWVLEPVDGLPLIGPMNDDPVLYASAFSGTGMTYAVIAAKLMQDYINGRTNRAQELYSPKRLLNFPLFAKKAVDYAGEIGGAAIKNTFTESGEPERKTVSGEGN